MSIIVRKGTDAERAVVTFSDGEVVWTTDTKKLYIGDGATVGGVLSGSGAAPVDSVAGKIGVVTLDKADITDFSESDYATGAEGDLATSALQSGDNISVLTNDSGYITSAPVTSVASKTGVVTLDKADITDFVETDYATGAEGDLATSALQDITGESIGSLSNVDTTGLASGDVLEYNGTNFVPITTPTGTTVFTGLTDTPANYTGHASKVLQVNPGETDLQFVSLGTPTLPTTTKGDVIVHNGTTDVRVGVGTNDQILTADSTEASGLKWADAAGGGTSGFAVSTITTEPIAIGLGQIAIGDETSTSASKYGQVAIGWNVTGGGNYSIGIGRQVNLGSSAKSDSIGIGRSVYITETRVIVIGSLAQARTEDAVAIGYSAFTDGKSAVAIGKTSKAIGDYSLAIGHDCHVDEAGDVRIGKGIGSYSELGQFLRYQSAAGKFKVIDTVNNYAQIVNPSHTTAARPSNAEAGSQVFDTTLGQPIWYDGTNWVDAQGTTV